MSQIRLAGLSVKFARETVVQRRRSLRGPGLGGSQADQAFADRVAVQADLDSSRRTHSGDILALDQVDLVVPDGLTMAIVGPSGCGKSTLLRVVAGLEPNYSGNVFYDDQNMKDVPPKDRYIGMVFQSYALYPHFEGHGNLSFFFRVHKAPSAEAEERIRETAKIMGFGFNELLDRKPGTLSGGQQQRLAIGRALVRQPRLFLFDEPLSNLDAKLRTQTRVEIKRLLHRFTITALYVTHDQEEAIALGDSIAVMREGRVAQVGPYQQLIDDPADAFVASFLGRPPMNLVDARIGPELSLLIGETPLPLPAGVHYAVRPDQRITVGVRPEAAWVGHPGQAGPPGLRMPGSIELVEPDYGRHTQAVRMSLGGSFFTVVGPLDPALRNGEAAEVVLPPDQLFFFDAESGGRIRPLLISP